MWQRSSSGVQVPLGTATFTGASVTALRDFLNSKLGATGLAAVLQRPSLPRHVLSQLRFQDPRLAMDDAIPDEAVQALLAAVMESTGQRPDEFAMEYGAFLMDWLTARAGFHQVVGRVSSTFVGFCRHINRLLCQMFQALGSRKPSLPEAQVTEVTNNAFLLGCIIPSANSAAATMFPGVFAGILDRVATKMFGIKIRCTFQTNQLSTGRVHRSCRVIILSSASPALKSCPSLGSASSTLSAIGAPMLGLDPETFDKIFPFHFALDMELRVLQAGQALKRMLPSLKPGLPIQALLTIRAPRVTWNLEALSSILQNDAAVKVVLSSESGPELCGALHRVRQLRSGDSSNVRVADDAILFIGTPHMTSLEDMATHNLYISDFPPHELAAEQMLVAAARQARQNEALHEAQQSNLALRETLAEALAVQEKEASHPQLNIDSAGHKLLQLLDGLLMGHHVDAQQVILARSALLKAGNNLWKPTDIDWSQASLGDKEVNEALRKLLGTPTSDTENDYTSAGGNGTPSALQTPASPRWSLEAASAQLLQPTGAERPSRRPSSLERARAVSLAGAGLRTAGSSPWGPQASGLIMRYAPESGARTRVSEESNLFSLGSMPTSMATTLRPQDTMVKAQSTALKAQDSVPRGHVKGTLSALPSSVKGSEPSGCCGSLLQAMFGAFKSKSKPAQAYAAAPEPTMSSHSDAAAKYVKQESNPDADPAPLPVLLQSAFASHGQPGAMTVRRSGDATPGIALAPVAIKAYASQASGRKVSIEHTPPVIKVLKQPTDEVSTLLRGVDDWQFDAFALDKATGGRPLSCLGYHLMERMGLLRRFKLDAAKLARFLTAVEEGYGASPYHCRTHAADVLRTLHVVLTKGGVLAAIARRAGTSSPAIQSLPSTNGNEEAAEESAMHLFRCYFSAIIHDYEHKGVNNDYLIKSSDPLALTYNDTSPLENHHVAAAFRLMHQDRFAFMSALSKKARMELRKDVIELVLATDMKQHFAVTSSFVHKMSRMLPLYDAALDERSLTRKKSLVLAGTNAPLDNMVATTANVHASGQSVDGWDHDAEMLVLKMALKVADLGHLTSNSEVHKAWVARLEEELFMQGDRERALGQPVSALMDRSKPGIQKSQCGFFTVVARPMFQSFADAFPHTKPLVVNMEANLEVWRSAEAASQGSTRSGAQ